MNAYFVKMVQEQKAGRAFGIPSCCTANRFVIQAALKKASEHNMPALIEATANQVDQNGGYTGMTPETFKAYVEQIARAMGFPLQNVLLGGDHLGPLTKAEWPADEAMAFAEGLVRAYVKAGFSKIHLDTSMYLGGDDRSKPLAVKLVAERGARLCRVAEEAFQERLAADPTAEKPVYIIGSEVPIPGGAVEEEEAIQVTSVDACRQTFEAYQAAFAANQLEEAFGRVIAIVVQPGVEFGDQSIHLYKRDAAVELAGFGRSLPLVFEGHSTDYQPKQALREMVEDGIAILKVGPALTFALREVLFALESIECELYYGRIWPKSHFRTALELSMLDEPRYWLHHYHGSAQELHLARQFSLSDRARYYLPNEAVGRAIDQLILNIDAVAIPFGLIKQYLPSVADAVLDGSIDTSAEALILAHIGSYLDDYYYAIGQ